MERLQHRNHLKEKLDKKNLMFEIGLFLREAELLMKATF
jgi:hypothetical protein